MKRHQLVFLMLLSGKEQKSKRKRMRQHYHSSNAKVNLSGWPLSFCQPAAFPTLHLGKATWQDLQYQSNGQWSLQVIQKPNTVTQLTWDWSANRFNIGILIRNSTYCNSAGQINICKLNTSNKMYEQKLFFHYMLIFLFYVKVPSDSQILENTLVQHICMNKSSADLSVEHMSDEKNCFAIQRHQTLVFLILLNE